MIINSDWLKSKDACQGNIDIFSTEWPEGCEVNHQNLERAFALGLDIKWLLRVLLAVNGRSKYNEMFLPIQAEHRKKRVQQDAEYESKLASLEADYDSKRAPLTADHKAKIAQIYADQLEKVKVLIINTIIDFFGQDTTEDKTA